MSTEHDSLEGAPTDAGQDVKASGPSPSLQSVSEQDIDGQLTASFSGTPSEKSSVTGPSLNLPEVLKQGFALSDSPDEARQWLLNFDNHKPGTDVSYQFKGLSHQIDEESDSGTFLSLLNQWLALWSAKSDRERKENKTARTASHKEQKNLDWLLRYTSDYLALGHPTSNFPHLAQTVQVITTICLNASRLSDINAGITVLYTIASGFDFPTTGLEQTLVVLCASAANLPETPDHLFDCAKILATGCHRKQVVDSLDTFILTPTSANNGKNLSHARGATRILRILLAEKERGGDFVFELEGVIDVLYSASTQSIFRFGHDVLSTLHSVLCCEARHAEIIDLNFTKIVGTVEFCLKASPLGNQPGRSESHALSSAPSQDDDHRQHERHFRDREAMAGKIGQDLGRLFDSLPIPARGIIDIFFLSYPQFAESPRLILTLSNLKHRYLEVDDDDDVRKSYAEKIYENIVQNTTLPLACRLKGIEAVVHSGDRVTEAETDPTGASTRAYGWILDKLLNQIDVEQDRQVFGTLLRSLEYMTGSYEAAAKEAALTIRTLEKLSSLILLGPRSGSWSGELAISATNVLVTIFAYSIHTDAHAAVRAFEILLEVASPRCKSRTARLISKRLLFRLRADDAGFIYINATSESSGIAAALLRTRESAEIFTYEVPTTQRHSASSTSLSSKSEASDPAWIYPDTEEVEFPLAGRSSKILNVDRGTGPEVQAELDMDTWLMNIIKCLHTDVDWETYSYTIVHVAAQLSNIALFLNSLEAVVKLRQVLCGQIVNATFREAPQSSGLKKSDVAICMFHFLTSLIPYATMKSESIQKGFGDDLVRAFISGLGASWEGTSRNCIHSLSVCSLEIPSSVASLYPTIIDKMSKNMTQAHLTSHILEFLTEVALQTEMHSTLNPDEIQMIFGVCIQFLEKTREQHHTSVTSPPGRVNAGMRHSGMNFRRPPYRAAMLVDNGLPQYAAALAYHNMIFWFLSLRLESRARYVSWIVPRLIWKNSRGEETIDEQSQVLIDMMQRTAFSDLGETTPDPDFAGPEDGPVSSKSWIVGLSIITAATSGHTGKTHITKRQASGTTYASYQQRTARLPSHHAPSQTQIRHEEVTTEILPSHVLLQMMASAATTSLADQPLLLPQEDYVTRALDIFDRVPTVASHKIGVMYVGPGQLTESAYLANTCGSPDFDRLLDGLGYTVSLEPPLRFNPQGLEYPRDGEKTIAWRDRVAEIVYHVPTLMPTDSDDPQCITKKSHVGNCHVNVIFNRSGTTWEMDHFKSQLNYVNIVIRPACRGRAKEDVDFLPGFYWVQVITKDGLPNLSPAAEPKVISAEKLAQFVRVLAINASQFCLAWNSKDSDREYPSEWRTRLQQIKILKERVLAKATDKQQLTGLTSPAITSSAPAISSGRRTPVPRDELAGTRRDGLLATQLDFSAWTL